MITNKEIKVLKFLSKQNNIEPVNIQSKCSSLNEALEIIDSLTKKNLVEDFSSFTEASVKITNEGFAFLENRKKEIIHMVFDWIKYGITTVIAIAALVISIKK